MEQLHNIEYIHGVSYPGMCKKQELRSITLSTC